jgi:hypothetical protein
MAPQHQNIYGAENKKIIEETSPQCGSKITIAKNYEDSSNDKDLESAAWAIANSNDDWVEDIGYDSSRGNS